MSYGSDFVTADPANAPLDPPLLVGADPVLWLALGLLLAAAGLFGWWLGARSRADDGDATGAIWKAVDKAAKEAMKADDHALRARAQHLLETLDRRLGRTLAVAVGAPGGGPGLGDRVGALRAAVDGRLAHGHGHDHREHDGEEPEGRGEDASTEDHAGAGPQATAVASSITINVAGGSGRSGGPGPRPAHREMTAREQTDALRLAVAAFNEHWRHEDRRVADLRAALAELAGRGDPAGSSGRG